jgi:hypothetical protein
MIILRVAMGHGWLKKTANEINSTIVFGPGASTIDHEQNQGTRMTLYNTSSSTSGLKTPVDSDVSVKKHIAVTDVVSHA